MPRVLLGQTFTGKNMAQMATTLFAQNLDTSAIWIGDFLDRALYFIIKSGPTATTVKLIIRPIKWCVALAAGIEAVFIKLVVLASPRELGPFLLDNVCFFGGQFIEFHIKCFIGFCKIVIALTKNT